jgi:hypothetical protein
VYVGFDNGDDLGMKGSDSALPVWADFMQKALQLHPEWNGDWAAPANIRKAEIDVRNGSLIREIDAQATAIPTPVATPAKVKSTDPYYEEPELAPEREMYVSNVPAEYRRVEVFVIGTVPNRSLIPYHEGAAPEKPTPSPTPLNQTWQESSEPPPVYEPYPDKTPNQRGSGNITLMICPLTGMRATSNCPEKQSKTFKAGTEPKQFCTFHVGN